MGYGSYDALIKESKIWFSSPRRGTPCYFKGNYKNGHRSSLGQSAIHEGLVAALIAGITVVLFMILYYKRAGLLPICF